MKILFQGDSITDAGRSREDDTRAGLGYPLLVRGSLGFEEPGKYEFVNRGISGNNVVDLYARMRRDIINIKPDVMSILIGVNDVWHGFLETNPNGVDKDKYFKIYDMLIEEIKTELPDIKIMILEPFVLKGSDTEDKWEAFKKGVSDRAEMARKIAEKHNLTFIELQKGFDELSENTGTAYWLRDGVHTTTMGHEFIKQQWIKAFKSL